MPCMRVKLMIIVLVAHTAHIKAIDGMGTGMLDTQACALIRGSVFANRMCDACSAGNAKQTWMFGQNIPQAQKRMTNTAFLYPSGIIAGSRGMNNMNSTANKPCITGLVLIGGVCYPSSMLQNSNTNTLLSKMSAAAQESAAASKLALLHAAMMQRNIASATNKNTQENKKIQDTEHANTLHVNIHTGQNSGTDKKTTQNTYKQYNDTQKDNAVHYDSTKRKVITIGSTDKRGNVVNDIVSRTVHDSDTPAYTSTQNTQDTSIKKINALHNVHIDNEHSDKSSDDTISDSVKVHEHTMHNKDTSRSNNNVTDKEITQKIKQILTEICKDTQQCAMNRKTKHKKAHRRHTSDREYKNKHTKHTETEDASSDASSSSDILYTTPYRTMPQTEHNVMLYPSIPKYRSQKKYKRYIPYRKTIQRVQHVQPEIVDDVLWALRFLSDKPVDSRFDVV